VKNQWGSVWGIDGYHYVSYEDVPMQKDTAVAFAVEKKTNYKYNYQYDGGTTTSEITSGNNRPYTIANTFKAAVGSGEKLKAVGFGTWSEGARYRIQIYRNTRKGKPFSGKKLLKTPLKGTLSNAGFYTIKLKNPVKLKKGYTYTVAVQFLNSPDSVSAMVDETDDYGWMKAVTRQKAGQSYYYDHDGLEDLSRAKYYGSMDSTVRYGMTARIKMYTTK